jgi:hypothetical protein
MKKRENMIMGKRTGSLIAYAEKLEKHYREHRKNAVPWSCIECYPFKLIKGKLFLRLT